MSRFVFASYVVKVEKCFVKVISEKRSPGIQPEGGGQRDRSPTH